MDSSQIDNLVQRLVSHPHDEEALAQAHHSGASDPKSYAMLLERVGAETRDPAYASHWLSEAANVWSVTLGDAHRAARVLMQAIDRDPTQRVAADRLSQLYRDKGDVKALVALLERRAKALAPLSSQNVEIREDLGAMHEELGRLWSTYLHQPKKGLENFRRAVELTPTSLLAVRGARELHKSFGQWDDAIALSEAELALESDPERRLDLLRERGSLHRAAGDLAGASQALGLARQLDDTDATLQQEYGGLIVERLAAGEDVPAPERTMGAELLVGLAEEYDGEHGLAYSAGALDIDPGHDRALQLYAYYAHATQHEEQVTSRYLAYVQANPQGAMASDARWVLAASYEAAAQLENAIVVLEPLRLQGDARALTKLHELYALIGQEMPAAEEQEEPAQRQAIETREPEESPPAALAPPPAAEPVDVLQAALDDAQALSSRGQREEAFQKYEEVLAMDASHVEALAGVRDYLRAEREHALLRDVLVAAARAPGTSASARSEYLREVADLCEGNMRDVDGAIAAYSQLLANDAKDEAARQALERLFEKARRWDDLARLLEEEANAESDLEKKVAFEKKIAVLHEQKRSDPAAAAAAWERIARLTPEDEQAIATASDFFEQAGASDRAARMIADHVASVIDPAARAALLARLGRLREQAHDTAGAGEAYAEAASTEAEADAAERLWAEAERNFQGAERWGRAAESAVHLAEMASDARHRASHFARAAEHFDRAGDEGAALESLVRAADLDPASDDHTARLVERFTSAARWIDVAGLLTRRAERLTDKAKRVAARRAAAILFLSKLQDKDEARATWLKVLQDGDDKEALEHLADGAVERHDPAEAAVLLRRLGNVVTEPVERVAIALREAETLAEGMGDIDAAIERYENILGELEPTCRPALQAVADLQEARDQPAAAANALERELKLVTDLAERAPIASRLARLYEQLDDPASAMRALELVRASDPDDFDALTRLYELSEKTKSWDRAAELLAQRIEVEADEAEAGVLTRKLAQILADELDRGDEALAALTELGDAGNESVRAAYVELGDRLGWRGIVATKLVEWWFQAKPGAERTANLRGAFERFAEVGREQDAVHVACEVVRSKGGNHELAERLEQLSIKTKNLDALAIAHDLLARDLTGIERARELARQAETRLKAGATASEALQHGESGLTSVPPSEAEELIFRLAELAEHPAEIIDLYERQIGRTKAPLDRVKALARAAQVASLHDDVTRARGFFDLALIGTPTSEALSVLEEAARSADAESGDDRLRRALCAALAAGGQGSRDGGRTRGSLMRRAASIVHVDLGDVEQAFSLLADALIAHVEPATLDALEALSGDVGDPRRTEATLSRALGEVFDGPLVRQLLARRAKVRREQLDDASGAAADLRKLHELSPTDQGVADELSTLLGHLGDYPALVQLYEDLILRGKDLTVRTDLARKVARMWEKQLADPREAADAWRRVMRMKPGDTDATAGLERAKANMLRRRDASDRPSAANPPASSKPPASQAGDSAVDARAPAAASLEASNGDKARDAMDTLSPDGDEPPATAAPPLSQAVPTAVGGRAEANASAENAAAGGRPAEDDVLMADDVAEMIDVDDERTRGSSQPPPAKPLTEPPPKPAAESPPKRRKRSVPPPLPRE